MKPCNALSQNQIGQRRSSYVIGYMSVCFPVFTLVHTRTHTHTHTHIPTHPHVAGETGNMRNDSPGLPCSKGTFDPSVPPLLSLHWKEINLNPSLSQGARVLHWLSLKFRQVTINPLDARGASLVNPPDQLVMRIANISALLQQKCADLYNGPVLRVYVVPVGIWIVMQIIYIYKL